MFKGSIVALITPFKNNVLDEDCYINLIQHHLKNGTSGLVPAGTTGESPTLDHEEHKKVIELCVKECNGKIPIIGVGGVDSGESAFEKIAAGASAVQLYTGLIYKGPNIVKEIKKDLIQILKSKGFTNINEAVGSSLN